MTLQRVEIFKTHPGFNAKAAQAAYDLVMKMDEDQAREFTSLVVANVLEETIEKNLRTVQGTLDRVVSKRMEMVKRATVRSALAKRDEEALGFTQALAVIAKAGDVWDENKVNRDPASGRFRSKISHNQTKPVHYRTARSMGIQGVDNKKYDALTTKQKAEYQDEYRQLANFLSTVQSSTRNPGDTDILLHFKDKRGGRTWTERQTGTKINRDLLYDTNHQLMGVEAVPNSLSMGGAAFGLTSALGSQPSARTAEFTRGVNTVDRGFGSFSDSWNAEVSGQNSNEQLYGRLSTGSEFLGQIAPAGSKTQIAARFGQFVGDHGAEAEAVVGPHARKTAYRYRGTSKTPDKDVASSYERAVNSEKMANAADPYRNTPDGRRANLKNPQALTNMQMAAARIGAERRAPTWEERAAGRGIIANWLMKESPARPKQQLYNLQLASGNTPPSEGFIVDADGKVTDQAIGYGDDHYLPFNLKNLKSLRGGEYIRSRSVGGLTAEDVYTGLMSGARQVTVVSRSGSFTMEFEPDFKGGRRYNDKALRMTKRYVQLLDAVQSQQVDRINVSPEIRNAIRDEVMTEMGGFGMPSREIHSEITRRIQEFKENPELSENDEKLARLIATQRAGGRQGRDAEDFMADAMSDLAKEKEYKFRLNGAGYAAALEALHEQFPYYIKVNAQPRIETDRFETEVDQGYVEPGRNRPTAARAGLFGTNVNPGKKFSASHADYQGAHSTRHGGTADGPEKTLEPVTEVKPAPNFKSVVQEQKQKIAFAQAAQGIQAVVRDLDVKGLSDADQRALAMSPADLADPANQRAFDDFVNRLNEAKANLGTAGAAYSMAAGHVGNVEYSNDVAGVWGKKPYAFAEWKNHENPAKARVEIDMKAKSGITVNKPLSQMTDAELQDEHSALSQINTYLSLPGAESMSPVDKVELLNGLGVMKGAPGLQSLMEKPENVLQRLRMVHQMRALNQDVSDEARGPANGDIVITNAIPSPDRAQEARNRVLVHALGANDAADWLDRETYDTEQASVMRAIASKLTQDAADIRSDADADNYIEANQTMLRQVNDAMRRVYANRGNSSGSIIG